MKILIKDLEFFVAECYKKVGVPFKDAYTIAKLQVFTDSRGIYSHGTGHLPSYIDKIQNGTINPTPNIKVKTDTLSVSSIDADNGLGHVVGYYAMQSAIKKAEKTGIGAVAVQNSSHYGAASCFTMLALKEGMIGFSTSQTRSASVAPFGGMERLLDNAPMSYAIPTKTEPPIVLDMACGTSSWGRIKDMAKKNQELDFGHFLDINGELTRNPKEVYTLLPFGGAKGYGLTLVMSILSGFLGRDPKDSISQNSRGQLFMAIDIRKFGDYNVFLEAVDEIILKIRNSNPRTGFKKVIIPGERAFHQQNKSENSGIELDLSHLDLLYQVSKNLSVDFPWKMDF